MGGEKQSGVERTEEEWKVVCWGMWKRGDERGEEKSEVEK